MQRVKDGEITLVHVKDVENPSDFLTKWVSQLKYNASIAYVTGCLNRVPTE